MGRAIDRVTRRGFLAGAGGLVWAAALGPTAMARGMGRGAGGLRQAETYFPWSEVGEGVHAVADLSSGGNVMVVVGQGASAVVDTKYPALGDAVVREAAGFGAPVTHVINTHHHGDHTGGNGVVKGDVEVLLAHAKAEPRIREQLQRYVQMARGGPRQVDMGRAGADAAMEEAQAAAEAAPSWGPDDFAPNRTMEGGRESLTVGGVELVLHHFGAGHTDNDVVVQVPASNVLHAGDLCFHGLHPYFDPEGGVTCRGWSEAVARTIELCDAETVVVPGHGEITDRSGLEAQKRYLDALWEHVMKEVRAGTPKEEATAMRWDFMDGLGFEQVRARAIGAAYDEAAASRD